MTFKETYEKKGDFQKTDPDGKTISTKYKLSYKFTDKMKEPKITIRGNPDEETIEKFISDVKKKFKREFSLSGSNKVRYIGY